MSKLQIILRDLSTGAGRTGLAAGLTIRSKADGFTANLSNTFAEQPGKPGCYTTDFPPTHQYKLYYNDAEEKSWGGEDPNKGRPLTNPDDIMVLDPTDDKFNALNKKIKGVAAGVEADEAVNKGQVYDQGEIAGLLSDLEADLTEVDIELQEGIDARLPIEGGTMDGDINMDSNRIRNVPAAEDPDEPVNVDFGDDRYIRKEIAAAVQQIWCQLVFRKLPLLAIRPVGPFEVTDVKFVQDYVNRYLNQEISNAQQTETLIIIDFNGTQEENRRYLTVESGINQANEYATADRRIVLLIEGSGNDDTSLLADYNRLPVSFDPYIDIVGIEQSVILVVDGGEDYSSTNLGENIISNVTLILPAEASPTGLTKKILRNVKFTSEDGTGQFNLTNCIVENCSRENCTVTTSGCIGNVLDITNSQEFMLHKVLDAGGAYEISYANGDIRGRRQLGRQGADVASAAEITLGVGNYFVITGTTNIEHIIKTGWTDGSVITLEFSASLDLINAVVATGSQASIFTNTGSDKSFAAGDVTQLVLTDGETLWKEL